MEESLYNTIFAHQMRHWFFAAKRYFFYILLGKIFRNRTDLVVADVGCGTGAMLTFLGRYGRVLGLDISPVALSYAGRCTDGLDVSFIYGKGNRLPLVDNAVDMVCLSDVLYHKHVSDDVQVLRECHRILKVGGVIILSDSAFKVLRGGHDDVAHSARRYSAGEIKGKLEKCGFIIKRVSYTYAVLFPIVLVVRFMKRLIPLCGKKQSADFSPLPYVLDILVRAVFFCEAQALRFVNLPFGISVMAVAVKK